VPINNVFNHARQEHIQVEMFVKFVISLALNALELLIIVLLALQVCSCIMELAGLTAQVLLLTIHV
jgi:hypothetical protein